MKTEVEIANGFAKTAAGEWLAAPGQPAAAFGRFTEKGLRGFLVPDRAAVRRIEVARGASEENSSLWFAAAERPFLTRLDAPPDDPLNLVSSKLLVAPVAARLGAQRIRPIPMSLRASFAVTSFRGGWAVAATASRVERIVVEAGQTLAVAPAALVGWIGKKPTGFCPRLGFLDLILPRTPRNFALDFHGEAVVWVEGAATPALRRSARSRIPR